MDIRPINSVMAGMEVTVSKTDITYNGWTGCGYIVINPVTGSGGYMISGGMAGAMIIIGTLITVLGVLCMTNPITAPAAFMLTPLGIGLIYTASESIQDILGEVLDDVYEFYGESWLNMACNALLLAFTAFGFTSGLRFLYQGAFSLIYLARGIEFLAGATVLNQFDKVLKGEYTDCEEIL